MHRAIPALFIVAIAACAAALLPGCGQDCTLAACSDVVTLELPANLPPGRWTIDIQADGMDWRCEATLPAATRDELACTGYDVEPLVGIDDAGAYQLRGVALYWTPTTVAYVVQHDGVEVARRDIGRPAYRKYHPNGEECDGDYFCRTATVAVGLEELP